MEPIVMILMSALIASILVYILVETFFKVGKKEKIKIKGDR